MRPTPIRFLEVSEFFPLFQPLATVLVAYLVYRLGLRAYQMQKEYELVRARYLEAGIDRMASNFEYALSVFRQNHARALHIAKLIRDVGLEEAALFSGPQAATDLDDGRMEITASHRVRQLVNSQTFWDTSQLLFAEVKSANYFFEMSIGSFLSSASTQKGKPIDRAKAAEIIFQEAQAWHGKIERYYHPPSALQALATLLESSRFTLIQIGKFHERSDVREIVRAVRRNFPDLESRE
jgi:hypothetical protein